MESPQIVGYAVSAGNFSLLDPDCDVLSMMPPTYASEIVDDSTEAPNPEVLDVKCSREMNWGTIYAYRILDHAKYFASICRCEWPVYVLPRGSIDLSSALQHYGDQSLTRHLLALSVPFGSLNDNHQDDCYAVSYRRPFWRAADESLAFIA